MRESDWTCFGDLRITFKKHLQALALMDGLSKESCAFNINATRRDKIDELVSSIHAKSSRSPSEVDR